MIRDYFGEETALYFAWLGNYARSLLVAVPVGLICFAAMFVQGSNGYGNIAYAIFLMLWATVLTETWKRKQNSFVIQWGTSLLDQIVRIRVFAFSRFRVR